MPSNASMKRSRYSRRSFLTIRYSAPCLAPGRSSPPDCLSPSVSSENVSAVPQNSRSIGSCSGYGAQWQQELGALAMAMSDVFTPDLCRMGLPNHPSVLLGWRLLSSATSQGQYTSICGARARLQMDPHPLSLLASRTPYDESKYLHALMRRGSKLLQTVETSP